MMSQNIKSNNFILQWNCNGFLSKLNDLKLLIQQFCPTVICIQESHLSFRNIINFNSFNTYRYDYIANSNYSCNGVITLIHKSLHSEPIPITSDLQVVAVKIYHPFLKFISICNIYIDHRIPLTTNHLNSLYVQLPKPCIIVGDFNAHHILWGSLSSNPRGLIIEKFLLDHIDIGLLNDGSPTHFNLTHKDFFHNDLSLSSVSMLPLFQWHIHEDIYFSDHFPIIISFHPTLNFSNECPFRPWSYGKADWVKYQELTTTLSELPLTFNNINFTISKFNESILQASNQAIPKCQVKTKCVPWWCNEIADSIKKRKKALKKYHNNRSLENFIYFKKCRAQARQIVETQKRASWTQFLSSIDKPLDQKSMWNQLKRLKGKYPYNPITIIKNNNIIVSNPQDQAEIFAQHFSNVSKSLHYDLDFQNYKILAEQTPITNFSDNSECFNEEFSLLELQEALKNCKSSATGLDEISYPMLQNLPLDSLKILLSIYNQIWISGIFPEIWRRSVIVPICKPAKDPKDCKNYRPISLISCVSKTLEKMVNTRLRWILESKNLLSPYQNGCIRNKSTLDSLALLEHDILKGFALRQHTVLVSLDIEKAFDLTWRHKIIQQLHNWKINGRILTYLENFLNNRSIQVKINNHLSSPYNLENGILQGSSLSATLWNINILDITKCFIPPVKYSIYVDDIIFYMVNDDQSFIKTTLQNTLTKLSNWAKISGPKFSNEKTKMMVFSRRRPIPSITLEFNESVIQKSDQIKILGMIFDKRLTWKFHFDYTRSRTLKASNILQILNNKNNGLSRKLLLRLYKSYVRPIIEYGAPVYGSASNFN